NPIYKGKSFGPLRITPLEPEDITGRTYTASVYNSTGTKLADFTVAKIDANLGIIEISMTATESAKLTAGVNQWEIAYTESGETRLDWA
ncbi:hypothetical protein, partial [Nesterenkonia sp. K-15-9-6]|uniref:hypothetical protein n=1 Tax=Nesterenkonia sp. K-15-9-6 TaxID=3093918 RepID=UPI004043F5E7